MERKGGFQGRKKHVSGESGQVHKRGEGLNLGSPLGDGEHGQSHQEFRQEPQSSGGSQGAQTTARDTNQGVLNTKVADGTRDKHTVIGRVRWHMACH